MNYFINQKNILRNIIKENRGNKDFRSLEYNTKDNFLFQNLKVIINYLCSTKNSHLGLYSSINGEPNILDLFLSEGYHVALPKIINDKMFFSKYRKGEKLCYYKNVVKQTVNNYFIDPDIYIIPGLSFDFYGNRLGFGSGHYDKFFVKKDSKCKIGVCYHEFLYNKLPRDNWDFKLDYLVTDLYIVKI